MRKRQRPARTDDALPRIRGKRGRYHHGDLHRGLLDAALVVLAKKGAAALTLREVARRAGVSHAAPYRHFRNKDTLLAAVAEEGFRRFRELMLEGAAERGPGSMERWRGIGLDYLRFAVRHPDHFRVMFSKVWQNVDRYPGLQEAGGAAFDVLMQSILEAQEAGAMRPGDPRRWAAACWSGVHGAAVLLLDAQLSPLFPEMTDPVSLLGDSVLDALENGLKT